MLTHQCLERRSKHEVSGATAHARIKAYRSFMLNRISTRFDILIIEVPAEQSGKMRGLEFSDQFPVPNENFRDAWHISHASENIVDRLIQARRDHRPRLLHEVSRPLIDTEQRAASIKS
jgi:hypothetical protein